MNTPEKLVSSLGARTSPELHSGAPASIGPVCEAPSPAVPRCFHEAWGHGTPCVTGRASVLLTSPWPGLGRARGGGSQVAWSKELAHELCNCSLIAGVNITRPGLPGQSRPLQTQLCLRHLCSPALRSRHCHFIFPPFLLLLPSSPRKRSPSTSSCPGVPAAIRHDGVYLRRGLSHGPARIPRPLARHHSFPQASVTG